MSRARLQKVLAFAAAATLHAHPCESCHPREVAAYTHSGMARSLRRPANEPQGAFTTASGTRFTIRSDSKGTWQRMERFGGSVEYQVAYVIGSGSHASGYLIQVGDHLFQSPLSYYSNRKAYDLSPGYERTTEPDFTRPVGEECVLCHSGMPQHIAGTPNQYRQPVFLETSISCQRCHGSVEEHLKHPGAGSIVNPAKLAPAARDSVCEQCHLVGATQRILNPGKVFGDFHAGQRVEEVFSVYTRPGVRNFRVISHSEQLALSACARRSDGKFWCGTCHDPHPPKAPTTLTYNRACQNCHQGKLAKSHPAAFDCIGCHMQRRPAPDGGHTVFTDHRIARQPEEDAPMTPTDELVAWREPVAALQARNLGLAYVESGLSAHSVAQLVRGYGILAALQPSMPNDAAVLKGIGRALQAGGKPVESLKAFEWVLRLAPDNAANEMDVGINGLALGQLEQAASHLQRALQLDPLLLSAGTALQEVYRRQGNEAKADTVAEKMRRAMLGK